jgi:hypothetical protein
MAQKIAVAADHGVDAFIFCWYYYNESDSGLAGGAWDGSKYLYQALEEGFMAAPNNDQIQFGIMWCNHNLGDKVKGAVTPETFERLTDYVIEHYFKHPSYWKINGCPYFSIYEVNTFLQTFGGDRAAAAAALERFREKTKAAGFPGLHLNGVVWGIGNADPDGTVTALGLDSLTSYVWIHHYALPDFPATDYQKVADAYFDAVENGGGANGLGQAVKNLSAPYHPNVSMGWDSSPRCPPDADWMNERGYPFGAIIADNTPQRAGPRPAARHEASGRQPHHHHQRVERVGRGELSRTGHRPRHGISRGGQIGLRARRVTQRPTRRGRLPVDTTPSTIRSSATSRTTPNRSP